MSPRIEAPVQPSMAQNPKQDATPVVAIVPNRRDRLAKPGVTAVAAKSEPAANNVGTNLIAATGKEAHVTPAVQSVPQARPSASGGLTDGWSTLFRSRLNEGGG
jgi:hypothetical protein